MHDATRERFGRTAERIAEHQDAQAAELEPRIVRFVAPTGDERALDSGTGTGALAFALAPHVREVVGVDLVPELLEQARKRVGQVPNVTLRRGRCDRASVRLRRVRPGRNAAHASTTSRGRSWRWPSWCASPARAGGCS